MSKILSLNGPESECIPSACLVVMLRKMAEKGEKKITVIEAKPEGRGMKLVGKGMLLFGGIYFAVHLLIWWAKP